ncbi:MAG: site-2 protease family protein [Polyangiaceae bacterium]
MKVSFRLGSIPVRIHLPFLLGALLVGGTVGDPLHMVLWLSVVFVSVLVHELGHALVGKAFGLTPAIDLHGLGGTTSWERKDKDLTPGRSILVSLAGPFAGFLVGGITLLVVFLRGKPPAGIPSDVVQYVLLVNIGWGIFNLLPMLPLDGGNVMAAFFSWFSKEKAPKVARYASIVVALSVVGLIAFRFGVASLLQQWVWFCLLTAFIVMQNVRGIQLLSKLDAEQPLQGELDEGFREIEKGNGVRAIAIAEAVFGRSISYDVRRSAIKLLAYGRLMEGQWGPLMQLLEAARVELGADELARFEQAAKELDRPDDAARIHELLQQTATGISSART